MGQIKQMYWFLLVCLFTSCVLAQEEKISLRTMQLGGDAMPDSWVKVPDSKEPVKLTWLTTQPTEPVQVLHDGNLKLLRYALDSEGKEVIEVMKTIKLPDSATEVLLLAWSSKGLAKYVVIEDLFLNAKFNDWIAINTSVNPVALLAGEKSKPVNIPPGKSLIFSPNIQEGKGVQIIGKTKRGGEVTTFLSSYWPAFAKQRTMIIFYDDGEKMRARRIGDRFLVKEEKKDPQ